MAIRKEDIIDSDFIDQPELAATGLSDYVTGVTVVSTNSATKEITVSGFELPLDSTRVESGDTVIISGSAASGTYTVDQLISENVFSVIQAIPNSTGGQASFRYPTGSKKVGFNPTGLSVTTATNVQDAIFDLANQVQGGLSGGQFTEIDHQKVRQLIHFISDGPAEGFASGAYKESLPAGSPFPTQMIWWTSSSKTDKIVKKSIVYNSNKTLNNVTWEVFSTDGYSVAGTVVDSFSYLGVIETSRIRTITQNIAPPTSPVTANSHRTLRQLIHFISEGPAEGFVSGAYRETLPLGNPFPTSIIWWTSSAKTNKIVEKTINYNSNKTPNIVTWKMYDTDGSTLLATVTDTHTYSGIIETNRVRSII